MELVPIESKINSEGVAINSSSKIVAERTLIGQRKQQVQPTRSGTPGSQLRATVCPPDGHQLFPSLSLAVVKAVSSVPGPLRVSSLRPHFNARHLAPIWPVNKTDVWYRLTAVVRALVKPVSARGLRIPIRPKPAAYGRTRDTRHLMITLDALSWCSSMVAHLDAFFGAPPCSLIRSALPFMVAISPMPCTHSGETHQDG